MTDAKPFKKHCINAGLQPISNFIKKLALGPNRWVISTVSKVVTYIPSSAVLDATQLVWCVVPGFPRTAMKRATRYLLKRCVSRRQ
jgi:hypothetical protein